jgi:hypothetical protein
VNTAVVVVVVVMMVVVVWLLLWVGVGCSDDRWASAQDTATTGRAVHQTEAVVGLQRKVGVSTNNQPAELKCMGGKAHGDDDREEATTESPSYGVAKSRFMSGQRHCCREYRVI